VLSFLVAATALAGALLPWLLPPRENADPWTFGMLLLLAAVSGLRCVKASGKSTWFVPTDAFALAGIVALGGRAACAIALAGVLATTLGAAGKLATLGARSSTWPRFWWPQPPPRPCWPRWVVESQPSWPRPPASSWSTPASWPQPWR
jgi:hypothetical protein